MWQSRFNRVAVAVVLVILLSMLVVSFAGAYAEEPIYFRDPNTGQLDVNTEISTIHSDLTYALALAAGFSVDDSRTLMIWNQLVDSERITTRDNTYTKPATAAFPTFRSKMRSAMIPASPVVGGAIAEAFGYPALFWVSLLLTFIGLVMMRVLVRDPRYIGKALHEL